MSVNSLLFKNNVPLNAGTLNLSGIIPGGAFTAPIVTPSTVLCANVYVQRAVTADNFSGNITGDADLAGWLNVSANVNVGTNLFVSGYADIDGNVTIGTDLLLGDDLDVGGDVYITGNVEIDGWLDVAANISSGPIVSSSTITGTQLISTIATGTAPFTVASTTRVTNLNAATSGTSDIALALKSATTTVNVSSATAPTNGQVLTATGGSAATWQDATSPTGNITATNINVNSIISNSLVIDDGISGLGNIDIAGWINTDSNLSVGGNAIITGMLSVNSNVMITTDLSVGSDADISGNVQIGGWLDVTANISSGAIVSSSTITGTQLTSTIATGTAPFTVASTTRVSNLNAATCGTADIANALKSATTTVNVSSATAPTSGQLLQATSGTTAVWATIPGIGANSIIPQTITVTLNQADILAMRNTPVELIPAPAADELIVLQDCFSTYSNDPGAGFANGNIPLIKVGTTPSAGNQKMYVAALASLQAANQTATYFLTGQVQTAGPPAIGEACFATNESSSFTGGSANASLELRIIYYILTVA